MPRGLRARVCGRARAGAHPHNPLLPPPSPPRPSAPALIWATGEGAQISSVDQETIAYAAMDITAKCVFGFILIFGHAATEAEATAEGVKDATPSAIAAAA